VTGRSTDDPAAILQARLGEYGDVLGSARAKLSAGDYHAEDLVDDWFRWMGMVTRDAIAAVTVLIDALPSTPLTGRPNPESPDPES
jgi:hypothetical protein